MKGDYEEMLFLAECIQSCWEDALPNLEWVFSAGYGAVHQEWAVNNFGVPASTREEDFLERCVLPLPLLHDIFDVLSNLPEDKRVTADEQALQTHVERTFEGLSIPLRQGAL